MLFIFPSLNGYRILTLKCLANFILPLKFLANLIYFNSEILGLRKTRGIEVPVRVLSTYPTGPCTLDLRGRAAKGHKNKGYAKGHEPFLQDIHKDDRGGGVGIVTFGLRASGGSVIGGRLP